MSEPSELPSELPGDRIRELRKAKGFTLRSMAENCNPPMDYTSIGRIEKNIGYTKDSLERFATVLGCNVSDFFLYDELKGFTELPEDLKQNVAKHIQHLIIVAKNRVA